MALEISTGQQDVSDQAKDQAAVTEAEMRYIVTRAVSVVKQELYCTQNQAIAAICRDWMELRRVDLLSPNQLEHSSPADFKPTWLDRFKQFF